MIPAKVPHGRLKQPDELRAEASRLCVQEAYSNNRANGRKMGNSAMVPEPPVFDIQSRDSGAKPALRRAAIEEMNARHRIGRARFYGQRQFCRQFQIGAGTGLCAGLVQVWWGEWRRGNDAIERLRSATPALVRDVLVSQARSVYLKNIPLTEGDLNATETELLRFKYGIANLSEIMALRDLFGVESVLELDLVLQHEAPIQARSMFTDFGSGVLDALTMCKDPGLRLLMIHYNRKRRAGQHGHRTGLAVERDGSCAFYDPSMGEIAFSRLADYGAWLREYWSVRGWSEWLRRGTADLPPIQIFRFAGELVEAAAEKALALRTRLWELPFHSALTWINVGTRQRKEAEARSTLEID